jgi:hypothetical protein
MKHLLISGFVLLLNVSICAQPASKKSENQNIQFGFKVGAAYSKITDLSKVLVSESYYTGYTFENRNMLSFTAGLFLNYKFDESISAIYTEFSYSRLGNRLHYSDVDSLNYDFDIKYEYINLEAWYKAYPFKGFHLGIGARLGFNITPGALYYKSNGELRYGPDIRIQQQMRDVLKGRTNFAIGIGAGYELGNGITIDARYYYGLSDLMETEVNNFNFIENKNSGQSFQITIGYIIPHNFSFF